MKQNRKALNLFQADAVPSGYYRLTKLTEDLRLILDSLNIHTDPMLPTVSDLKQLKYGFDKAFVV